MTLEIKDVSVKPAGVWDGSIPPVVIREAKLQCIDNLTESLWGQAKLEKKWVVGQPVSNVIRGWRRWLASHQSKTQENKK